MNSAQHEVLNLLLVVAILILILSGVGTTLLKAVVTPDNAKLDLNPLPALGSLGDLRDQAVAAANPGFSDLQGAQVGAYAAALANGMSQADALKYAQGRKP